MAFTHFRGLSVFEDGYAVGKKGEEVVIITADGDLILPDDMTIADTLTVEEGGEIVWTDTSDVQQADIDFNEADGFGIETLNGYDISVTSDGMMTLSATGTAGFQSTADTMTISGFSGAMLRCTDTGTVDLQTVAGAIQMDAAGGIIDLQTDTGIDADVTGTGVIDMATADGYIGLTAVGGRIALDSSGATPGLTGAVDSGDVEFSTTTSGNIALTPVDDFVVTAGQAITLQSTNNLAAMTLNHAGMIDIDSGAFGIDIDSGGTLALDGVDAVNLTSSSGAATLSGDTGVIISAVSSGGVAIDATAGGFSIDSAAGASNVTADTDGLTLATTTAGSLDISSAADVDIDGATGVTIDATTGGFSIDAAAGASNITVDTDGLTIETTTAGELDLTSAGAIDINSGTAMTVDTTTGAVTITSADDAISLVGFGGAGHINITNEMNLLATSIDWSGDDHGIYHRNNAGDSEYGIEFFNRMQIPDNSTTTVLSVAMGDGSAVGGVLQYHLWCADNSSPKDIHAEVGTIHFLAVQKAGAPDVFTTNINEQSWQAISNAGGGGTLATTWAIDTATADTLKLTLLADTTLNVAMTLHYRVFLRRNN